MMFIDVSQSPASLIIMGKRFIAPLTDLQKAWDPEELWAGPEVARKAQVRVCDKIPASSSGSHTFPAGHQLCSQETARAVSMSRAEEQGVPATEDVIFASLHTSPRVAALQPAHAATRRANWHGGCGYSISPGKS